MAGSFRSKRWKQSPLAESVAAAQSVSRRRPAPPPVPPATGADGEQITFGGGFNLPEGGGRSSRHRVAKGFGEIRIEDGILTLRPLRQPQGRFVPELYLTADDVELASPIDLNYVGSNRGLALRLGSGGYCYLWSDQPAELLARLAEEGFATGDTPVVARGIVG